MLNVKFDTTGLDKLTKNLKNLEGKKAVPFKDLFTPQFLKKHTKFSSLEDMFAKSRFTVNSQEDFKSIPDAEWDKFITDNSNFASWQEMLKVATGEWAGRRLLSSL